MAVPGQLYGVPNMKTWEVGAEIKLGVWWLLTGSRITKSQWKPKDYKILPPFNIPSFGAEPESNLPGSSNRENEDHEKVIDDNVEHPSNESLEWGYLEIDSSYDNELCER